MSLMKNMTVNRLPARTWNWLKMNESYLTDIQTGNRGTCDVQLSGSGIIYSEISEKKDDPIWEQIETGMGPDMKELGSDAGSDLIHTETGKGKDSFAVLRVFSEKDQNTFRKIHIYAEKGSTLQVAVVCTSPEDGQGLAALQTMIQAEEGARVKLYLVQMLGEGYTCLSDIGGNCEKGALIELVRLELGAGKLYAGMQMNLTGDKSELDVQLGYLALREQNLDMNYVVRHTGKKTASHMNITGVLRDHAEKLFRGSIDFRQGCAGAKGEEKEDVLLLGDNTVNRTIPLILCQEEDVEGNHGATIGRLDEHMLFYLGSRGITKEEAERLIARARIDAVADQIPDQNIRKEIGEFLERRNQY